MAPRWAGTVAAWQCDGGVFVIQCMYQNGTFKAGRLRWVARQPDVPRPYRIPGGDWVTVLGEKKHVHGYLKEFLFEPAL